MIILGLLSNGLFKNKEIIQVFNGKKEIEIEKM